MTRGEQIRDDAMRLTRRQRLKLEEEILASAMTDEERDVEDAWLHEAPRRRAAWKVGKAKSPPVEAKRVPRR